MDVKTRIKIAAVLTMAAIVFNAGNFWEYAYDAVSNAFLLFVFILWTNEYLTVVRWYNLRKIGNVITSTMLLALLSTTTLSFYYGIRMYRIKSYYGEIYTGSQAFRYYQAISKPYDFYGGAYWLVWAAVFLVITVTFLMLIPRTEK